MQFTAFNTSAKRQGWNRLFEVVCACCQMLSLSNSYKKEPRNQECHHTSRGTKLETR